jgi:hypothetical protein
VRRIAVFVETKCVFQPQTSSTLTKQWRYSAGMTDVQTGNALMTHVSAIVNARVVDNMTIATAPVRGVTSETMKPAVAYIFC